MTKRLFFSALLAGLVSLVGCMSDDPTTSIQPDEAPQSFEVVKSAQLEQVEPNLEEDYNYPNADQFRPLGITLKRGDGHILFVDCSADYTLKVETSTPPNYDFCFQVKGSSAYLSLELSTVYLIGTSNHDIEATVVRAGKTSVLKLKQNFTSTTDSNGNQATLTELRLSAP